ncbi:MAG: M48 family metallopeptidase [Candidatus Paceibacterota bacterium]
MTTLYTHQSENVQKTWFLMIFFLVLVIAVGWALSYWFQSSIILYIAVGISLLMNFFAYWRSDKVALSRTGAHPADERQYRELHNIVENLAITAGLPKPRVYIINDQAPNAFATGRDPKHAVIAVTTGLMDRLDRSELEGVIAHELAHIGNRDILVMSVAVVLAGFIAIATDILLRGMIFGGGRNSDRAGGIALVIGLVLAILSPLFAKMLQMAVSRKREFLADASGALLTRYPDGLASALEKISSYTRPMQKANHATAHLFISSPFGPNREKGKMNWFHKLWMTHPPVEERIAALKNFG